MNEHPAGPDKIQELFTRLLRACQRLPDWGGDLWSRGQAKIEEKYGFRTYLSRFEPVGMAEGEAPVAEVTIEASEDEGATQ